MVPTGGWAPVLYGRTAAADTWWQAVPAGISQGGWLAEAVRAVYAGGRELPEQPRFVLADDRGRRLVGVACPARALSASMYFDGSRELTCFVGWLASGPTAAGGPLLADLAEHYAEWAAPVYREIMAPVWKLPQSSSRRSAATKPGAPPWPEPEDGPGVADRPAAGLWPPETWPRLWTSLLAAPGPYTCVVGWPHGRSARRENVTHLGVGDAPAREAPPLPLRPPPVVVQPPPSVMVPRSSSEIPPPQPPALPPSVPPAPAPPVLPAAKTSGPRADEASRLAVPAPDEVPSPELSEGPDPTPTSPPPAVAPPPPPRPRSALSRIPSSRRTKAVAGTALAVAIGVGVAIGVTSGGSGFAALTTKQLTIAKTGQPTADALFVYQDKKLAPGPKVARMVYWRFTSLPSQVGCTMLLAASAKSTPRPPRTGEQFCVRFAGSSPKYGIAAVGPVNPAVRVTLTEWP